jgi:D-glycero-D-manno-heptose 1,7-bisphosphate phosphatase
LIVISNQAGIGRGYFTEAQYRLVEAEVARQVRPAIFDAVYFCPDRPDRATNRRKPAPGMIFEAQRDHDLDLARSYFIGDKAIDIACGRNAGLRTILVRTGYGANETHAAPHWLADDFSAAADIILNEQRD